MTMLVRLFRRLYRSALWFERWTRPKTHDLVDWDGVVRCEVEEIVVLHDLIKSKHYTINVNFEKGEPTLEAIGTALLIQGVIALSASGVDPIVIDTVVSRSMELGTKSTKWDKYRAKE